MKPLPEKSLDTFCQIYTHAQGQADITCPADDFHVSCLGALERRGLIQWDTERTGGKMKRWCALTRMGAKKACDQLAQLPTGFNDTRNRVCLSMFLDLNNDDHYRAWQVAQSLKGERIFTPVIVDLLLMHSEFLRQEDTTFSEAYPGMYKLMTETRQEDLLNRLENLLQNTPQSTDTGQNSGLQPLQGIKTIGNAQPLAKPVFEESEDDLLEVKKDTSNKASQNFLKSMMALQGIEYKD
jgi:hypothetical protein